MVNTAPRHYRRRRAKFVITDTSKDARFREERVPDPRAGFKPMSRLTHQMQSRVHQPDDCLCDVQMTKGEHRFVFDVCTSSSSGGGIRMGVASADGYYRWGVRASDGRSIRLPSADAGEPAVMLAEGVTNVQERACVRRVEVVVDMARRTVQYSVDGAGLVDSGVLPDEYPDTLVPWVQLFYKHDAVMISSYRRRSVNYKPQPRSPPKPPRKEPASEYEAGPWIK
jgi:hypothetical protein